MKNSKLTIPVLVIFSFFFVILRLLRINCLFNLLKRDISHLVMIMKRTLCLALWFPMASRFRAAKTNHEEELYIERAVPKSTLSKKKMGGFNGFGRARSADVESANVGTMQVACSEITIFTKFSPWTSL